MANSPPFVALAFLNAMGYCYVNVRVNSINNASILCKNFVNFSPVTPELTELICELLDGKNWHIQPNISRCTGPIFMIFSPYVSALHADDRSGPLSPICQGSLPWQPNNFGRK